MISETEIVQTEAVPIAILPMVIPRDQIRAAMGPGLQELFAAVAGQGRTATGPWFTHHLRIDPEVFDFAIGLTLDAPCSPSGRIEASTWPALRVAKVIYEGPYEGLGSAWGEFDRRLAAEGHRAATDLWERYLAGPESGPDPDGWRTELIRPLLG